MKCIKCGKDLGIESNSAENVKYCSSCEKHDFPEDNSIEEVLRWIVQDRGVEVFQNSGVINALLSDLAPKDEKGRMKIKNALAVRAGEYFYAIVQQGILNDVSRKQFLSALSSNGFTIEFCNFIFDVFAYSINQSVAVQEKETTKTSANDAYENIAVNTEQNNENVSHNTKTDTKRDKKGIVKGKLTFPSGVVYEGELMQKYPNGKGKMIWPDGSTFEGQFLNGCRVKGQFHYPNGVIYEGGFKKNMRQGTAKEVYPNGDLFVGEFLNDKRKKGIYILHDLSGSQLLGNQAQSLIGVLNCVEHQSLHVLSVLGSAQRVRRPEPKLLLRLPGDFAAQQQTVLLVGGAVDLNVIHLTKLHGVHGLVLLDNDGPLIGHSILLRLCGPPILHRRHHDAQPHHNHHSQQLELDAADHRRAGNDQRQRDHRCNDPAFDDLLAAAPLQQPDGLRGALPENLLTRPQVFCLNDSVPSLYLAHSMFLLISPDLHGPLSDIIICHTAV